MRLVPILALAFTMLPASAMPAGAQSFVTPFFGYNFGGDSVNCISLRNCDERRTNIGVSIGSMRGIIGLEQDIAYVPHFFRDSPRGGTSMFTAMSNLLVVAPLGRVVPYGLLGLGLMRPHTATGSKNALGYDIGAGVNVFVTKRVGLRADLRRLRSLQDVTLFVFSGEKLEFWRASLGLSFR